MEHLLNYVNLFPIDTSINKDKFIKKSSLAKGFVLSLLVLVLAVLYTGYRLFFFSESREDFIAKHIDITMETAPFLPKVESRYHYL